MRTLGRAETIILAAVLVVWLPACTGTMVASPRDCALMGAMVGGLGGAAGGAEHASDREDGQGVTIGIGGVLVGAGLGYLGCALFLDEEVVAVAEPEPEPEPEPVEVVAAPPPVSAPIPEADPCVEPVHLDSVMFEVDKSTLTPNDVTILDWVAESLSRCPDQHIRIEGHTDATGSDGYNQRLSEDRAKSVRSFLGEKGIDEDRMTSMGFGESRPVAPNDSREGRAKNRRVDLIPID